MTPPPDKSAEPENTGKRLSPLVRFAILAAVWLGVSALFALQASALGFASWTRAMMFALFDWGPWIVFSPVVLWFAERLPITQKSWRWAVPAHLAACLLIVALIETAMSGLSLRREFFRGPRPVPVISVARTEIPPPGPPQHPDGFGPGSGDGHETADRHERPPPPPHFIWFRLADRARFAVPVYWMLVAAAHALASQRRSADRERRALRAEALLAEARLNALQAQLNPHFLFNTLNTIAQLVYDNPRGAEEMITSLSELLRAVLAAQNRREVTLDEEIELLESYFAIQKVRFADRLNIEYDVEPSAANVAVPTLLLQPLAENAIKHGITPDRAPGTVHVRARSLDHGRLRIEIADTGGQSGSAPGGADRPLEFRDGVGLANTRARLETLYPGRHLFSLERAPEGGVLVRIEIPLRRIST